MITFQYVLSKLYFVQGRDKKVKQIVKTKLKAYSVREWVHGFDNNRITCRILRIRNGNVIEIKKTFLLMYFVDEIGEENHYLRLTFHVSTI